MIAKSYPTHISVEPTIVLVTALQKAYLLLIKAQNISSSANKLFRKIGHPLWTPRITSSKLSEL